MGPTGNATTVAAVYTAICIPIFWIVGAFFLVPTWKKRNAKGYSQIRERWALWLVAACVILAPIAFLTTVWIGGKGTPVYMGTGVMAHTVYWLLFGVVALCVISAFAGIMLLNSAYKFDHQERAEMRDLLDRNNEH